MWKESRWNKIRMGLQSAGTKTVHEAAIEVGKVLAEELPEDLAHALINLFDHPAPEVRMEAVRAIGLHWRLASATNALGNLLNREEDAHVQCSAIGALGALGLENANSRVGVSRILAGVVLNERFADYERMVAYLELQRVEGRIDFEEYLLRDRDIPESLATFDIDQAWVQELTQ